MPPKRSPARNGKRGSRLAPGPRTDRRRRWVLALLVAAGLAAAILVGVSRRPGSGPPAPVAPAGAGQEVSPEEAALEREAAQKPRDPDPWRRLGELYLSQRQPFEAIWSLQEALERGAGHAPTLISLAAALEAAEQYRPGIDLLSELLRRSPGNREARALQARLYLRAGEAKPALAVLRGAESRLATWPEGLLELGRALVLAGDPAGAIAAYRRHLAAAPNSAEGAIRLVRVLLEEGQLDAARRALEQGRAGASRDPRFLFYLGLSWMQDGHPQQPERAMARFKESLAVAPQTALPHHYLGLLLGRQGRWSEAQAHFLKATQADPTYADPQRELARALEKTGHLAQSKEQWGVYYFLKDDSYQAAQAFKAMVKIDPSDARAWRLVSLAYLRLGRNDWAIRETRAALKRHPRDTALLERLATLYLLSHSRPAARQTCRDWLAIEPGAARAHWLLGRAAQDDLQTAEAIREYEIAVAAEPGSPEYAASLAAALSDAGSAAHLRRAAGLLQEAIRLDPRNASYRHDLGMTLLQLDDLEGARRQLLAALDRNPHRAPTYSSLSQLCARLQKPAMARFFAPLVRAAQDRSREELRLSRQIGRNPTSPEAHAALAGFLIRTAAFPTAQSHLERALELRPHDPEARARLAYVKRVISAR